MLRLSVGEVRNMKKKIEKRLLIFSILTLVFLAVLPAVAFQAQQSAESSSGEETYDFGAGTTVESLQDRLSEEDGAALTVLVLRADGSVRESGPLVYGDLVEVYDGQGNLMSRFRYASSGGSSLPADVSSAPEQSEIKDSGSSASSPSSSSASDPFSAVGSYYVFSGAVTVNELEDQLSEEGETGSYLTVDTVSGSVRQSGNLCTGDILTAFSEDGSVQSRVKVIVLGDVTRSGGVTENAVRALYDDLTGEKPLSGDLLRAADMNQDGDVTTADLLLMKKAMSGDN